jgi:hypothetical protein
LKTKNNGIQHGFGKRGGSLVTKRAKEKEFNMLSEKEVEKIESTYA